MARKNGTKQPWDRVLDEVRRTLAQSLGRDETLGRVCTLLHENVKHFDWVGFYILQADGDAFRLGPFVGSPTEHVLIPLGRGICGQAAARGETFVVQDVAGQANYLSCSPLVKSEIVAPIFKEGKVVAELDIDSHSLAPFTPRQRQMLEKICRMLQPLF